MFDFSGKKVRKDGVVLDKYSLGVEIRSLLGYNSGWCYVVFNSSYSYLELVDVLKNALS